jgi:hypothetical protein
MKGLGRLEPTVHDAPVRGSRPRDMGFAITEGAALAACNNVTGNQPWHHRRYVLLNLCATGAALSVAATSGLTAADWAPTRCLATWPACNKAGHWCRHRMACGRRGADSPPGLEGQAHCNLNGRAIAYQAVIRIPIGTVLRFLDPAPGSLHDLGG